MLTREILKDAQKCDNCHTCLARTERSKYSKYDKPNDWHYLCDLKIVIDSHIEALDEIERLKAELAAQVGHETTKRTLVGNIDDFGAISQCEKCYKMLDVFMKFCPNCGRKIEGGDKA